MKASVFFLLGRLPGIRKGRTGFGLGDGFLSFFFGQGGATA